jgi:hypothetical protein
LIAKIGNSSTKAARGLRGRGKGSVKTTVLGWRI